MLHHLPVLKDYSQPVLGSYFPLPHPPVFHEVFILKGVKVVCFDTLSEVFILRGLHCTKIVQYRALPLSPVCAHSRFPRSENSRRGTFDASREGKVARLTEIVN